MFLGKNCTKEINAPAGQTKQQQSLCLCGGLGGGEGEGERKGNREEERELLSIYLCVLSLLPHPHPHPPKQGKKQREQSVHLLLSVLSTRAPGGGEDLVADREQGRTDGDETGRGPRLALCL